MEKLELKHIVGYLPYGLKIQLLDREVFTKRIVVGCTNKGILRIGDNGHGNYEACFDKVKPILRPLSDLIKEIEVNGEKFVPIKKLGWEYYDGELGSITNCVYGESPKTTVNVMDYLYDLEQLYEWHFDIHGLIEKGLAIDINTLDNGIQ